MKFAHHLNAVEPGVPAQFRGKLLNYKALKKFLKACYIGEESGTWLAEERFFTRLEEEVVVVSE
jgi:SPX domain protein involved in polyphosphate accumulation